MATRDLVSGSRISEHSHSNGSFHTFAGRASLLVGSKWAFTIAVLIILFWGLSGPYFHFSDTWHLVVNTATTIVTFLIVFLIRTRKIGMLAPSTSSSMKSFMPSRARAMK